MKALSAPLKTFPMDGRFLLLFLLSTDERLFPGFYFLVRVMFFHIRNGVAELILKDYRKNMYILDT